MLIVSSGEILTVDFANVAGPRVEVAAKTGVRPDLFEGDGQGWCCTFAWNVQDYMPKPKADVDRATRVARHLRELGARTDILKSDDELRARNAQSAAASLSKAVSGENNSNNNSNTLQKQQQQQGRNQNNQNNNNTTRNGDDSTISRNRQNSDRNENNNNDENNNDDNLNMIDSGATTYKEILPPGVISARQSHIDFGRRLVMFPYGQSAALAEGYDDDEFEEILAGRGGRSRNKNSSGTTTTTKIGDEGSVSLDMIEKRTGANRTEQNEAVKKMILSGIPAGQDQQADYMQKRKQLKDEQEREKQERLRQLQLRRGGVEVDYDQDANNNNDNNDHDDYYDNGEDDDDFFEEENEEEDDDEESNNQQQPPQRLTSVKFAIDANNNNNNNSSSNNFKRLASSMKNSSFKRSQRSNRSGSSANSEPFVDATSRNLLRHNRSKVPPPPIAILALVIDSRPIVLHLRAGIFTSFRYRCASGKTCSPSRTSN